MKRSLLAVVLMLVIVAGTQAQFKDRLETGSRVGESLVRSDNGGLLFGWFDPSRLTMRNSYSLSYTSFGSQGFSLGTLTSSMAYQISDPLSVAFDVSLMHSPFNNLGSRMGTDLSGIYLTRAQLDYRPSDNVLFQIQFRQIPSMYWMNSARSWDFFGPERLEEDSH